jgi:radical SAM-linked protein
MLQSERENQMTRQPHQDAHVVRACFSRIGNIVYIGHLDLMRTFERSLRRAGLPILHTQGYNPRPSLVFALPLGVGIATVDDYIDIFLEVPVESAELITRLNDKLPDGLHILEAWSVPDGGPSLMSIVTAASYRLTAPGIFPGLQKLLLRADIPVMKRSKGAMKLTDIRPFILSINETATMENEAEVIVMAGSSRNLRPDLLLQALHEYEGFDRRVVDNCEVLRTGLYTGEYPNIIRIGQMPR